MKKRCFAVLLALALCLGLFPVSAQAAETEAALTGAEMAALLPSEAPEVTAPESINLPWNESEEEATFQEIAALTERLTSGTKTETEKARAIFDWVANNISYDYTAYEYDLARMSGSTLTEEQQVRITQAAGTGYAFYYRRAVCSGYAGLANLMLNLAGLPAAYISGKASAYDATGHAWSAVYADGQWILFDATWDEWDISPDFHAVTNTITWTDGVFWMEISRDGHVSCAIQGQYRDITSVTIPDSVTAIGTGAFGGCANLTSVTIPDNVTAIGNSAFSSCSSLTSVTIPDSVTSIGKNAFSSCTSLTRVDIPDSVTDLGQWAFFYCTSLTDVTIPDGVTELGQYMFASCRSLTSLDIPDSVTEIGVSAFKDCTSLTSVTIPESVTSIEGHAFENCTALTSATIQGGLTSMEAGMFWGCSSLASVTLPASVTSIGQAAFYNCPNVKDVYYSGSEEQWNAIEIGMFNSPLARGSTSLAAIHCNTVGGFGDVNTGDYYANAVQWAIANGITNGTSTNTFSPMDTCSQGQILTFLWRTVGEPEPAAETGTEPFYAKAAQWAKEQGLTTDFDANAPCTRAMVVTCLWKLAGSPTVSAASNFTDVPAAADYAKAVAWAVEKGITTGTSATTFSPDDTCVRGQIVTFLYRTFAE